MVITKKCNGDLFVHFEKLRTFRPCGPLQTKYGTVNNHLFFIYWKFVSFLCVLCSILCNVNQKIATIQKITQLHKMHLQTTNAFLLPNYQIQDYGLPLIIWSSPQRDCATSGSKNVTKLNALNGLGMNTSVTSPNFPKYSFKSSAVMSSVHLPIKTLHGTCWISPS